MRWKLGIDCPESIANTNMPIRFRCAYCNQLLGISKRKAGTVVRCPTCAGQVIVPNVETEETETATGERDRLIFERNNFDELLNSADQEVVALPKSEGVLTSGDAPVAVPSAAVPPPGAWGTHAEPAYDVERLNPASGLIAAQKKSGSAGIHLSPWKATVLAIVVIVLLALAFGGGLLLGLSMRPASTPGSSARETAGARGQARVSVPARTFIPDIL